MSCSTLIQNALLINEGHRRKGSVLIEGETIREVFFPEESTTPEALQEFEKRCAGATIVQAEGLLLMPGVIDDHVHFRDPGLTHKADIASESRAAAAGGVTSYMDMPNCNPQTTTLEALQDKFENAAQHSLINYSFYFGATNNNLPLLRLLPNLPHRPCAIKLFMGSSTGNMLVDKRENLRHIFEETDLIIATHCEDTDRINRNTARIQAQYGEDAPIELHPLIRDAEACYASTALAVDLASASGARLHVLHLTTEKELSLFSAAPLESKRITAEVCLAHLRFTDRDYATLGARIKCNPAVKTLADRTALRRALAEGRIDVVSTDHAPHLLSEKQGGALRATSGMPMLQFSLPAMLDLCVEESSFSYELVVEKMCHAPAQLFGIEKRGYIRPGYKADLVLVSPHDPWTLTTDCIQSKCGWSPLEGQTFTHRIHSTFVNGIPVYQDGKLQDISCAQELRFH